MRCKPCSEQRGYPFKRGHRGSRTDPHCRALLPPPLSQHDKGTGAVHQCERNDGLEHRRRQVGSGISFSNPITAGQSFSIVSPVNAGLLTLAIGSMGASGIGSSLAYQQTASFTFNSAQAFFPTTRYSSSWQRALTPSYLHSAR